MTTGVLTDTSATHQDLVQFLAQPGCAICRYAAQAEQRYFDTLLYERVLSPAVAQRMRASNGLCGRHLETLLAWRNPLATAILYQYVLQEHRQELARWRHSPRGRPPLHRGGKAPIGRHCPACEAEGEAEERACDVLAAGLDSGSLRAAWEASAGLCWPHFTATRPRCRGGRASLDAVEAEALDRLAADVEASIRSYDYQWQGTRSPDVEAAWRHVVAAMAGRFAGGKPMDRRPAAGEPRGGEAGDDAPVPPPLPQTPPGV
jgi:hypothetical protein